MSVNSIGKSSPFLAPPPTEPADSVAESKINANNSIVNPPHDEDMKPTFSLGNQSVRIGSFAPLSVEDKALFAAMLKPQGEINHGEVISGIKESHYSATSIDVKSSTLHAYEVSVKVHVNGQLQKLTAKCTSDPNRNSNKGVALDLSFAPIKSRFESLPTELKLQIASLTGKDGKGVALPLRATSKDLGMVAQDRLSTRQRFLIENGQALAAMGYGSKAMDHLEKRPAHEKDFVLANGEALKNSGHNGRDINNVAALTPTLQQFILTNAEALHTMGYPGDAQIDLSKRPPEERDYVLNEGPALRAQGYLFAYINTMAKAGPAERSNTSSLAF